jgi:hypothetical protein
MMGPKRAIAGQQGQQRDPKSRGTSGGEPVRVWLLGGFQPLSYPLLALPIGENLVFL